MSCSTRASSRLLRIGQVNTRPPPRVRAASDAQLLFPLGRLALHSIALAPKLTEAWGRVSGCRDAAHRLGGVGTRAHLAFFR